MKIEELMIGDWVKLMNSKGECIDYSQLDENLFCISIRDGEDGCLQFSPIPLTAEILEKSGWEYDIYSETWSPSGMGYSEFALNGNFEYVKKNECYGDEIYIASCRHLHQLQHALRLCGHGEIADNIKI